MPITQARLRAILLIAEEASTKLALQRGKVLDLLQNGAEQNLSIGQVLDELALFLPRYQLEPESIELLATEREKYRATAAPNMLRKNYMRRSRGAEMDMELPPAKGRGYAQPRQQNNQQARTFPVPTRIEPEAPLPADFLSSGFAEPTNSSILPPPNRKGKFAVPEATEPEYLPEEDIVLSEAELAEIEAACGSTNEIEELLKKKGQNLF